MDALLVSPSPRAKLKTGLFKICCFAPHDTGISMDYPYFLLPQLARAWHRSIVVLHDTWCLREPSMSTGWQCDMQLTAPCPLARLPWLGNADEFNAPSRASVWHIFCSLHNRKSNRNAGLYILDCNHCCKHPHCTYTFEHLCTRTVNPSVYRPARTAFLPCVWPGDSLLRERNSSRATAVTVVGKMSIRIPVLQQ